MKTTDYIIIALVIIGCNVLSSHFDRNEIESLESKLQFKIDSINTQQQSILQQLKSKNTKGITVIKKSQTKIRKDAKIINNRTVTNAEITEFLAKYRSAQ